MSDRETRLRAMLQRRAEEFPAYGQVPPDLAGRARRAVLATVLVLSLAVAGIGFGAFAGLRALRGPAVPASPAPSVAPSTPPSGTSSYAPSASPLIVPSPLPIGIEEARLVLPLPGPAARVAVAPGADAVFVAYTSSENVDQQVIARLPLESGTVVESAPLPAGLDMAVAGDALWVSDWDPANADARLLFRLDLQTLAVLGTTRVRGSPFDLAAAPSGLWVGAGTYLHMLDATVGRVVHSVKLDGQVGPLSVDPEGRLLYASTHRPGYTDPRSLVELDAATGAIRVSAPVPRGVAVTGLSATADGVWVTVSTGLQGTVDLYRPDDLQRIASFGPKRGGPGTNAIGADVADGILWVADSMAGALACADPLTGRLRAIVLPQASSVTSFSNLVAAGSDVYVGIDRGLVRIAPSARCRT